MDMNVNENNPERGMEIFGECLAGMLYSDEEIRSTLAQEDADEFIALRNELLQSQGEKVIGRCYDDDETSLPLAAEDGSAY